MATKKQPSQEVDTVPTVSFRDILPNPDKAVSDGASSLLGSIGALTKAADTSDKLARFMLDQYIKFSHSQSPDLMAKSQAARDFASEVQRRAREAHMKKTGDDEDVTRQKIGTAWRLYKRRMSDLRAAYANSMDEDPDAFREQYPLVAERYPDHRPAEALSLFYKIDLVGESERDRLSKRANRLRDAAADPELSEKDRQALLSEVSEIEQRLGTDRNRARTIDAVRAVKEITKRVGAATAVMDPDVIRALPDSEKRIIAETYPAIIGRLSAVFQAATTEKPAK